MSCKLSEVKEAGPILAEIRVEEFVLGVHTTYICRDQDYESDKDYGEWRRGRRRGKSTFL